MHDITHAGPDTDFEAILELLHICFAGMEGRINPPSSLARLTYADIARHSRDDRVLLIEDEGQPIACVFVTPKPGALYLGKLAVHPSHQGRGHARRLINHAEQMAASRGLPCLELQTRVELAENHVAFGQMGFAKTGETSHPGYDRPTSITMRRAVSLAAFKGVNLHG